MGTVSGGAGWGRFGKQAAHLQGVRHKSRPVPCLAPPRLFTLSHTFVHPIPVHVQVLEYQQGVPSPARLAALLRVADRFKVSNALEHAIWVTRLSPACWHSFSC